MTYFLKTKFTYIVVILLFSCKANTGSECSPLVNYNLDTINIGNIKKGDSANIIFKLKNVSNCDFYIKKIGVGCGCTEVHFDSIKIKPNQESIISLKYKNRDDSGDFVKTIVVESNSSPTLRALFVKGKGN